ncbi:AI-2E family transporter [Croceicoccus estronivorus]|uniref:AI-2E family transporter n=1 Tax=Croceicoccus estronivorus TaxID=1172626 RepID=UPI000829665C|nr:AI-2E family transporter [Croceicoccus estronivorus]OCC25176.1 AI-2E family transporter [Croceicoccus estronivorus]
MDEGDPSIFRLEDVGFIALVLLVTLAFVWLIAPYFGAILWGLVAAILFAPLNRKLCSKLGQRKNLAAMLTVLLIVALVIIPAFMLGIALVQEATAIYGQIQSGQVDFAGMYRNFQTSLPDWASRMVSSAGVADFDGLKDVFGSGVAGGLQAIASRALLFGQGALKFIASLGIMLYLTFFLLRDGDTMGKKVLAAVPLRTAERDALLRHFVVVVRATMKGTVVVALLQGLVGGLIFWALGIEGALLWGLLMGFFSLVPAVGTGIVWVPVSIYLLVTGSIWEGVVLVFCGLFVIGLIDNLLRPFLVGQDTRMPDFVVLIATLAGLQLFGLNGFIVGPMIAALFMAVWSMVAEHRPQQQTG